MEHTEEKQEKQAEKPEQETTSRWSAYKKPAIIVVVSLFVFVSLAGAAVTATETYHKDRIFHGVSIGGVQVGGLKLHEARSVLETWHDKWWADQLVYDVYDENGSKITTIDFQPLIVSEGSGQSYQFISYDLEAMLEQAHDYGRDPSMAKRIWNQAVSLLEEQSFQGVMEFDEKQLQRVLELELEDYETMPQDAQIVFATAESAPEVTEELSGNTFNYRQAILDTYNQLMRLESAPVAINRAFTEASISADDAEQALAQLESIKSVFPMSVTYFDDRIGFDRNWTIRWADMYEAVSVVTIEEQKQLGFSPEGMETVWERFENVINEDSQDAKFEINEDGKVQQFLPSQKGYKVNREATIASVNTWLQETISTEEQVDEESSEDEEQAVQLAVDISEAKVPTADVNDLGITEVLGVGYSNFSGSPRNRVHNISIGAEKLDGLLIEPGETFSLLEALKPFTISEGYLPELVIKGDKIEPEIGGGLCQIGSTTFRAAMKSGLPIAERRNHSLVVDYYNDPRNGNPGTDATIYDSSPDFKFVNDTGSHILIKTDMSAANGDLYFTFWGTSDGREADYTEPVVHRWIGTGPTRNIETTDLAPGQKKCQGAHPGAVTSFTYTVTQPDGEVVEEVFESSYRPLPTICLVGVDPNAPKEGEESEEGGEDSGTSPSEDVITSETDSVSQETTSSNDETEEVVPSE